MATRRGCGGRGSARLIVGASLLIGLVAGCRGHGPVTVAESGTPSPAASATAPTVADTSATGQPTATSGTDQATNPATDPGTAPATGPASGGPTGGPPTTAPATDSPTTGATATGEPTGGQPSVGPPTTAPATDSPATDSPTTGATATDQPTLGPPTTAPATAPPGTGQPTPTLSPTTSSPPATDPGTPTQAPPAGTVFSETCPAGGTSDMPGCGSWDAGPSSGQAPGFAAGQQSSPNLLDVNQDPWTGSGGTQVLNAAAFDNWSVTVTDTDPAGASGEVLTYPDASFNYYQLNTADSGYSAPPPQYQLNNITALTSDFTESMPQVSDLNAEAAYDMWLNDWSTEVMVWVDTSPAKIRDLTVNGMTSAGTYTYDGQNFTLWHSGSGITGFYVFLLDHNETSGTVDLKAMLETMVSLGYIPAASTLTQIPFGWEVSDTGGKPVTLSLSRFDVNLTN